MAALHIKKGSTSHSAYNLRPNFSDMKERHTLAILVDNEPGVLARVIGLFSARGYNIESLTVAEVDHAGHLSRITIVERELALIKVEGEGEKRIEALRLAEIFRANVVDSTLTSFVFEMTGAPDKIEAFAELMQPLGLVEIARTGVAALSRGA